MQNKLFLLLTLIVLTTANLLSNQNKNTEEIPFSNGEKLEFEIKYFFGSLWVNVGSLRLCADTVNLDSKLYLNLKSESKTNDYWSWFYNVHSRYNVITNYNSLKPLSYKQETSFGSYQQNYEYNFSKDSIRLNSQNDDGSIITCIKNDSSVFDALSAIYYARTLNFDELLIGDSIEMNILHDNEFLNQKIFYDGIAQLQTNDSTSVECFLFSSIINNNKLISNQKPAKVWVSTGSQRLPLKISMEIIVGKVDIYLLQD